MASTVNAFDLLRSGGLPSTSKNKKKKSKSKQKTTADDGVPAVTAEPVAAETTSGSEVVELTDAVPILEKSARTQGANRIKLWKDWQRQATDRSPKALKYRAPDGSVIQFKELVLRSRALEIAVEGCIASPLSSDETHALQQLLSVFLPRADTSALASAIARLSELLAEDTQSFDTVGAAQRAVHNVISTLKTAKDSGDAAAERPATLQDRLAKIEREAGKQHGFLSNVEKLAAAAAADPTKRAPTSSGISRAHVDSASELVKLYADKFDLLRPGGAAPKKPSGSGPRAATIKALEELKSVINGHLQEASSLEQNVKGKAVSAEAKRAQAVASIRREEAVLAQQATELSGQIRVLESQLAQLRSQAAEVEDKRAKLHQRQSAALDALSASTGRKMPGLSAQHYNNELAAADQLLSLVDPSYCAADGQQLADAQAEHGNSAEQFMAAVHNMMKMSSSLLADVPSKVDFCRQRIAQADKLASLGGLGQEKSAKTREEATKLMNELVRNVTDVMAGAKGALDAMRTRYTSFTQAQQAGLSQIAYEVEDLMGFIQRQHDTAMGAVHSQPAPAAPGGSFAPGAPLGGARGGAPAAAAGKGGLLGGAADGAPLASAGVRPNYGANLGPIQPPAAAAGAPKAAPAAAPKASAPTSNGHAAAKPASAAAAAAMPAANDGFQQVAGKKNRRKV